MPTSTAAARALAVALLAAPVAALGADERIAVLEFTGRGDPALLAQLADEVRSVAADELRGRYVVMTREAMALVLKQMGGSCKEGECEVETARNVGAALVATGELRRIEKTLVLGLKLHETERGALLGAETVREVDPLKLLDGCREAAKALLHRALPTPAAVPHVTATPPPVPPAAPAAARAVAFEPGQAAEDAIRGIEQAGTRDIPSRDRKSGAARTTAQRVEVGDCDVKTFSAVTHENGLTCGASVEFSLREIVSVAALGPSELPAAESFDYGTSGGVKLTMRAKHVRKDFSCSKWSEPNRAFADFAFFLVESLDEARRVAGLLEAVVASCRG